jgi:hypothetical protein
MQALYAASMPTILCDVIASALQPGASPKKMFSFLKNAFFSIDLLLLCMERSSSIMEEQQSRGMVSWIFECCKQFVERHGASAWSAMESQGLTKVCVVLKTRFCAAQAHGKLLAWARAREILTRAAACGSWQAYLREHLAQRQQTESRAGREAHHGVGTVPDNCRRSTRKLLLRLESSRVITLLQSIADVGFSAKEEYQENKSQRDVKMALDKIKKLFQKYDVDQSETIDGDELYSLLRDLGHL